MNQYELDQLRSHCSLTAESQCLGGDPDSSMSLAELTDYDEKARVVAERGMMDYIAKPMRAYGTIRVEGPRRSRGLCCLWKSGPVVRLDIGKLPPEWAEYEHDPRSVRSLEVH